MKKFIVALLLVMSANTFAEPVCDVEVCNRTKRWSLNPLAHLKDHLMEDCYHTKIAKSEAVQGRELSSQHVSFINPTKRDVTYIKQVGVCQSTD